MTAIVELWSADDQMRLERFLQAVESGEPLDAILALNRDSLAKLEEAIEEARPTVEAAESFGGALAIAAAIGTVIEFDWKIQLEPGDDLLAEGDLAKAFATKLASPRTLAALWTYTAKRLGYGAHWLEMNVFHPISVSDGSSEVLVDSTSGRLVSHADCREIFHEVTDNSETFLPEMFDPPTAREVASEVLELRLAGAPSSEDETVAYRNMRFHAALHQDKPRVVFAAALAAAKIGDHVFATRTLKRLVVEAADTPIAEPAKQALERITQQFQYTN